MSQMPLPDPILEELDSDDLKTRRCRGWTTHGKRCRRTAPPWWPAHLPWYCRTHA